jgi:hypothetical protein
MHLLLEIYLISVMWQTFYFLGYIPKAGNAISILSVCFRIPTPIKFWMPKPMCIKLGMYIIAPGPISTAYFINTFLQSSCMCIRSILARQSLNKVYISFRY